MEHRLDAAPSLAPGKPPQRQEPAETDEQRAQTDTLFFDVSDLLWYIARNPSLTGVQRIQTAIIEGLIGSSDINVVLCRFAVADRRWQRVSLDAFTDLLGLSRAGQDIGHRVWQQALRSIDDDGDGEAFDFPHGAVLVNLGTSWWLPNYFLYIRHLQVTRGLRYVPFVHDMIPIMSPSFCTTELVAEFMDWVIGVLHHADHFLTNSEASRQDLLKVASGLGRNLAPDKVTVLPLDGDFRGAVRRLGEEEQLPASLVGRDFVLFVSTIDVRKNQRAAFAAWRQLINKHGAAATPRLVIVGKLGYRGPEILEQLSLDDTLSERVDVLQDVSDTLLAKLYRHCLFTIFPSQYEGWGLPVTEALSYGKAALVADNSSLHEAGGETALYFSSGSAVSFLEQLERLIFDRAFRAQREKIVAAKFAPRPWAAIGQQLVVAVRDFLARASTTPDRAAPPVKVGGYYPIQRSDSPKVWPGRASAEIFRQGTDWHELEPWGVRTRGRGGRLSFSFPDLDQTTVTMAVKLVGLPSRAAQFVVADGEEKRLASGELAAGASRWLLFDLALHDQRGSVWIGTDLPETVAIGDGSEARKQIGVGVAGFFVLPSGSTGRMMLVEALALQNIGDYDVYRRPFTAPDPSVRH